MNSGTTPRAGTGPSPTRHWPFPYAEAAPAVLCALVLVAAIADLIGWHVHLHWLTGLGPNTASMKPNTGLLLLLLSAAVWARRVGGPRGRILGNLLTWLALLLALATLAEYRIGIDLGLDNLLANADPEATGDPIGRMSIGTACDGVLTAVGLLLLDALPGASLLATYIAGVISLSALVSFLFSARALLGVPFLRSIAVRTAALFLIVQLCIFALRPAREPVRSLVRTVQFHRTGLLFLLGTCSLPLLLGIPVAYFLRHGFYNSTFALALLVVLLMLMQAALVSRNSRSLADVEDRRNHAERDRARLLDENERSYTELESIYKTSAIALTLVDATDLRLLRLNDQMAAMLGSTSDDLRGRRLTLIDGVSPHMLGMFHRAIQGDAVRDELFHTPDPATPDPTTPNPGSSQSTNPQLAPNDHRRFWLATCQAVTIPSAGDASPLITAVTASFVEVTQQKRAERALIQTEKLAAVGRLSASIAHEINNPLESVMNLLYLARTTQDSRELGNWLETAERELRRASVITSQTLRFHRQSSRPTAVRLPELVDGLLSVHHGRLINAGVTVEQRLHPTDPILCFEGEIRQVLSNLLSNATDAMHEGSNPGGRLLLRTRPAHDWSTGRPGVIVTVADTGPGMSPRTQGSAFDAFYTTKGINGTGLGLWISREIVDRHGGVLRVRSRQRPGPSGTVFTLFLPSAAIVR